MTTEEKLQVALGALADIASNTDMTLDQMQAKANRVYWELSDDDEDSSDNTAMKHA